MTPPATERIPPSLRTEALEAILTERGLVDPAVLEIEAAQQSAEAQALLVEMRSRLGLADPDGPRMLEQ